MKKIIIEDIDIKDDILSVVLTTNKNLFMPLLEHYVCEAIANIYKIKEYNLRLYWIKLNSIGYKYTAGETIQLKWYINNLNITRVERRDFEEEVLEELAYKKRKEEEEEKRKREKGIDYVLGKIKQLLSEKE